MTDSSDTTVVVQLTPVSRAEAVPIDVAGLSAAECVLLSAAVSLSVIIFLVGVGQITRSRLADTLKAITVPVWGTAALFAAFLFRPAAVWAMTILILVEVMLIAQRAVQARTDEALGSVIRQS
ncbi:hypothetical protein [Microbacterium gorillae]|uniref:hypothetical protein n=1 Tax=Microbacterium gorillae TaxID=1231063 RepID=UPI003D968A62